MSLNCHLFRPFPNRHYFPINQVYCSTYLDHYSIHFFKQYWDYIRTFNNNSR